jgi:ribosomal protein L14E/L6E/L27E
MSEEPLDEKLLMSQGEDVEWSMRVRDKYKYVMNTNSIIKLLRSKSISSYYVEGDEKYTADGWEKKIND